MKRSARTVRLHIGAAVVAAAFALPALAQTSGAAGTAGGTTGVSPGAPPVGSTTGPGTAGSATGAPMGGSAIGSGPRDARDIGTPPRDARDINGTGVRPMDPTDRAGSSGIDSNSGAIGSSPRDARDIGGTAGSAGSTGGMGIGSRSDPIGPDLQDDDVRGTTGATGSMNRRGGIESPMERDERIRAEQRRRGMERQSDSLRGATPPEGSVFR